MMTYDVHAAAAAATTESETENALRLIQIQNSALRDRLRAAAEENECLKDRLHQISSSTTPKQELQPPPDNNNASESLRTTLDKLQNEKHDLELRLKQQKVSIYEMEQQLQTHEQKSNEVDALTQALNDMKSVQQGLQAHVSNATSMAEELQQENEQLKRQIFQFQQNQMYMHEKDVELEMLRQTVATLEGHLVELRHKNTNRAETHEGQPDLQNQVEELQSQLDSMKTQHAQQLQSMASLHQQELHKVESETRQHLEELAQRHKEVLVSIEIANNRRLEEEISMTAQKKKENRGLAEQANDIAHEHEQLHSPRHSDEEKKEEVEEKKAALILQLEQRIEELSQEIGAFHSQHDREVTSLHAELATKSVLLDEQQATVESMKQEAHKKSDDMETMQRQVDSMNAERCAWQDAQHDSMKIHEELARLQCQYAEESEKMHERIATMQLQLENEQSEATAAVEAAKEEAGWLRQGAEELQRQLERMKTEAAEAAQHAEQVEESLRMHVAELTEQIALLEQEKKESHGTVAHVQNDFDSMASDLEKLNAQFVSLQHRNEKARGDLQIAQQELSDALERSLASESVVQATKQEMHSMKAAHDERVNALQQRIDELEDELRKKENKESDALGGGNADDEASSSTLNPKPFSAGVDASSSSQADDGNQEYLLDCTINNAKTHDTHSITALERDTTSLVHEPSSATSDSGRRQQRPSLSGTPPLPPSLSSPASLSMSQPGTAAPAAIPAFVPHHRRDPSYSSEIEPLEEHDTAQTTERPSNTGMSPSALGLVAQVNAAVRGVDLPRAAGEESISKLKERIAYLERELADSEKTHALRDKATSVLKEEIAELYRQEKRSAVDIDYVKNVLVDSFSRGELNPSSGMLMVLARLLHFSPAELEKSETGRNQQQALGGGAAASLTAALGNLIGGGQSSGGGAK